MKLILTEGQLNRLIFEERLTEVLGAIEGEEKDNAKKVASNLYGEKNPSIIYKTLSRQLKKGRLSMMTIPLILGMVLGSGFERSGVGNKMMQGLETVWEKVKNANNMVSNEMTTDANLWKNKMGNWQMVADDVIATVYNAVPGQCNKDVVHTASMFKLNLDDVLSHRIIAMERTFMAKLGLKYGDVVYVEGTGKWDGPWQIQDTMNKRFAGLPKIDFLVPNNIKLGEWKKVKLSIPADDATEAMAKSQMKGSV